MLLSGDHASRDVLRRKSAPIDNTGDELAERRNPGPHVWCGSDVPDDQVRGIGQLFGSKPIPLAVCALWKGCMEVGRTDKCKTELRYPASTG